jgi:hypothetical protein
LAASTAPPSCGRRPTLWAVKAQLRQQLLTQVRFHPAISILDSFPVPVCRFGRAWRCRRLAELAAFGRDEGAKQTFYGLRAQLRVCWPGVITDGRPPRQPARPKRLARGSVRN